VVLDAFVLDDTSGDGTSETIADQFPEVTLLRGDEPAVLNGGCGTPSPRHRRRLRLLLVDE
jgi:hypothetical protein